jgi:uncharacterized Zn finger protein (UPF0148 family)
MSAPECVWIPEVTKGGRTSRMFHNTSCGRAGAPLLADSGWKFCPYCATQLMVSKDPLRLRDYSGDERKERA